MTPEMEKLHNAIIKTSEMIRDDKLPAMTVRQLETHLFNLNQLVHKEIHNGD